MYDKIMQKLGKLRGSTSVFPMLSVFFGYVTRFKTGGGPCEYSLGFPFGALTASVGPVRVSVQGLVDDYMDTEI